MAMDKTSWSHIMEDARANAITNRRRSRVKAVRLSDSGAVFFGTRWIYVIEID